MALTIEEQHETNDLDHDILTTREVTFICGHKRVYEEISACQKSWMERCQRCPNCQYKRDKAYVEKLSAEINSPELPRDVAQRKLPPTVGQQGKGKQKKWNATTCTSETSQRGISRTKSVISKPPINIPRKDGRSMATPQRSSTWRSCGRSRKMRSSPKTVAHSRSGLRRMSTMAEWRNPRTAYMRSRFWSPPVQYVQFSAPEGMDSEEAKSVV